MTPNTTLTEQRPTMITYILIIILFRRKNLKTPKTNGVPLSQAKLFTMKCYRFSRRRKNYLFGLSDYKKSRRKSDYMINTGRSKMLDSGFFENEVWGALHKAWKGYVIAKNKDEYDKMLHYADIVQESQYDLRLKVSSFHNIGNSLRAAQIVQENKSNSDYNQSDDRSNQKQVSEEEIDHRYEQEKFTDEYSKDFRDDYNKADKFTNDNAYSEYFTDDHH
jgi:hypothetical protein